MDKVYKHMMIEIFNQSDNVVVSKTSLVFLEEFN